MYNSAYRNIRFHFSATYLQALWVFLILPILVAFSFGLAFPYFIRAQKKFIIDHIDYGTSPFDMKATTGMFYGIFFKMLGIMVVLGLLIAGITAAMGEFNALSIVKNPNEFAVTGVVLALMLIFPFYLFLFAYWYANMTNLVINHTSIKQYQFESALKTSTICWIFFSNTVAIILSLGLLIPWAMIRTTNYRISCMSLITDENTESFIAAEKEQADAIGEEIGDFMDLDLGL